MSNNNNTSPVEFNDSDADLVEAIACRWAEWVKKRDGVKVDLISTQMDIEAANGVNGNAALDLYRLLEFDDFNFAHDMSGIERLMNRETGKLEGCFRPRCALVSGVAA